MSKDKKQLEANFDEPRTAPVARAARATVAPATHGRQHLRPGHSGPAVAAVQAHLGAMGFASGRVDGIFGTWLERAVVGYQQFHGLPVTGEVDEATWEKLQNEE